MFKGFLAFLSYKFSRSKGNSISAFSWIVMLTVFVEDWFFSKKKPDSWFGAVVNGLVLPKYLDTKIDIF